ncbi:SDR family oxidoreductase [Amycolatopsis magusensis]|uniref:SDR family oxidoreductase n=1 Tax=Amycolatopsis magusensis TaxID=882444 RepID=UPI0024A939DC|nr:SDR family oxidoreductase [Amycolatopsis magusensis]MDI5981638.1 SDR family oxidoreductase [Amycolatopsis magusensis]
MRVFVTGATGHLGSAVVPELLSAGHEVVGLARTETSATALKALGAEARLGDLDDLDGLHEAASATDAVIHLAFKHEAMRAGDYARAVDDDLTVVRAFGDALDGTGKAFVGTSGTGAGAVPGRLGTEDDVVPGAPRVDAENVVVGFAERGIRSSLVRLPPTVHSTLDHSGFVPSLIEIARTTGVSGYLGDGASRWPAVHTLDAARVYRLALEQAPAGSRLHAVADEGVPFREIAEAIGRHLGVPATAIPAEQAPAHFGFLAWIVPLDVPVSSARTQELLGWRPEHPGLLADLGLGHYFTATT